MTTKNSFDRTIEIGKIKHGLSESTPIHHVETFYLAIIDLIANEMFKKITNISIAVTNSGHFIMVILTDYFTHTIKIPIESNQEFRYNGENVNEALTSFRNYLYITGINFKEFIFMEKLMVNTISNDLQTEFYSGLEIDLSVDYDQAANTYILNIEGFARDFRLRDLTFTRNLSLNLFINRGKISLLFHKKNSLNQTALLDYLEERYPEIQAYYLETVNEHYQYRCGNTGESLFLEVLYYGNTLQNKEVNLSIHNYANYQYLREILFHQRDRHPHLLEWLNFVIDVFIEGDNEQNLGVKK